MRSRTKFALTLLSVCGGAAAGTAFYALRPRRLAFADVATTPTCDSMTLINVQIFFRHGARTPLTNITGLDEVRITAVCIWCICRRVSESGLRRKSMARIVCISWLRPLNRFSDFFHMSNSLV